MTGRPSVQREERPEAAERNEEDFPRVRVAILSAFAGWVLWTLLTGPIAGIVMGVAYGGGAAVASGASPNARTVYFMLKIGGSVVMAILFFTGVVGLR